MQAAVYSEKKILQKLSGVHGLLGHEQLPDKADHALQSVYK